MSKKNCGSILLILLLPLCAHAQLEKGQVMLGGSVHYSTSKESNRNSVRTFFDISPTIAYFPVNNLAIGISPKFNFNFAGHTQVGIGPYARYYYKKVFVQTGFDYHHYQAVIRSGFRPRTFSGNYMSYGAAVGYAAFISKGVSIEPVFYYDIIPANQDRNTSSRYSGLRIGLQVYL